MTSRPKPNATGFVSPADQHGRIQPPPHCPRHRRWRVWFDFGHYEHGIVYRETKWRAQSPTGRLLEAAPESMGTGEYADIIREIDRIEDERAGGHRK